MKISRSEFFKIAGIGVTVGALPMQLKATNNETNTSGQLVLGMATYTLRNFGIPDVINTCQKLGLNHISLKSFHLPYDASPKHLKEIVNNFKLAGIDVYGAGVITMRTPQDVESMFEYASQAGIGMIIGTPNHDLLPLVEQQVKKTGIKLAIHNHGPEDKVYPSVHVVHEKIKNLDPRIGFCIDVGHVYRNQEDAAMMIKKYKNRLFDIHMKDIDKAVLEGKPQELGRGNMDIPAIVKALKMMKYKGIVAFEYEKDGNDPFWGLAESVGYVKALDKVL